MENQKEQAGTATESGIQHDHDLELRVAKTDKMIRNHMYGSIGVGLIPVPFVDALSNTAIQLNLVRMLGNYYGHAFKEDAAKKVISSLVGAAAPMGLAMPVASVLKMVPVVGMFAGAVTMSALGAGSTYALGKVFVQNFESGGSFLTLDPEKVRDYYAEQLEQGKKIASGTKTKTA
jgi:uncharacterized protein (DUF697 family)